MDVEEMSLAFAQELTKQFLSLASAIPAVMITFSKDFVKALPDTVKAYAFWSWGCFLLSVLFGLLTLMALTGILARRIESASKYPPAGGQGIMTPNVRLLASLQILAFFAGLLLVTIFGWKSA